jgi:hypothetical protein
MNGGGGVITICGRTGWNVTLPTWIGVRVLAVAKREPDAGWKRHYTATAPHHPVSHYPPPLKKGSPRGRLERVPVMAAMICEDSEAIQVKHLTGLVNKSKSAANKFVNINI